MKKIFKSRVLSYVVCIGIVLTILSLLSAPLVITAILKSDFQIVGSNLPMIISMCIYLCAIPYLVALFNLRKLCSLIEKNDPFSINIPKYLKIIGICSFSELVIFNAVEIWLCYLADMYLYALTIVPMVVVSFVCLAIGLLSMALSKLFDMAIEIKDENDKTI